MAQQLGLVTMIAAGGLARGLVLDQVEVVGVDLGHDERNVRRHAEGGGVGDDGAAGGGELRLQLAGDGRVDGARR